MRKLIAVMLLGALGASMAAAPVLAGQKKIHDSFMAQALPFPNLSSATGTERRGCFAGVDGVHRATHEFKAPANGALSATIEGFVGDWDLAIESTDGAPLSESLADQTAGETAEEEAATTLKKGQTVNIVACNWLGEPQIEVHFMFVFKK